MATPARIKGLVYILTPTEGVDERRAARVAQMASCAACEEGLEPIHPYLHYAVFLPADKVSGVSLKKKSLHWAKRCEAFWLCTEAPGAANCDIPLDPLTYQILLKNEMRNGMYRHCRDPILRPVYLVTWPDTGGIDIRKLAREDIASMLRCNIVSGMLRGGLS